MTISQCVGMAIALTLFTVFIWWFWRWVSRDPRDGYTPKPPIEPLPAPPPPETVRPNLTHEDVEVAKQILTRTSRSGMPAAAITPPTREQTHSMEQKTPIVYIVGDDLWRVRRR